jgi:hypothetical protein
VSDVSAVECFCFLETSKTLFGTLDADDADYYNEQFKHFEEETEDMTFIMNQQIL